MANTTTDISQFGMIERRAAIKLLAASIEQGFPKDFMEEGVKIMFNTASGLVFFVNNEFEVCLLNDEKLESYYACPDCGKEAFLEHMKGKKCCIKYRKEIQQNL